MKKLCDDCGCRVYDGACVNCHEIIFIEKQYQDLDLPTPESVALDAIEARKKIKAKQEVKDAT